MGLLAFLTIVLGVLTFVMNIVSSDDDNYVVWRFLVSIIFLLIYSGTICIVIEEDTLKKHDINIQLGKPFLYELIENEDKTKTWVKIEEDK